MYWLAAAVLAAVTLTTVHRLTSSAQSLRDAYGETTEVFMADAEMATGEHASVVINDDVAVEDSTFTTGRRGVAGTIIVEKIVGAAAEAALEWTVEYTRERKAFGRAVADFQNTRFKLADVKSQSVMLRVFIDRSVVEVFVNERICLAVRVYPSRSDSRGVSLCSRGRASNVVALKIWQMKMDILTKVI